MTEPKPTRQRMQEAWRAARWEWNLKVTDFRPYAIGWQHGYEDEDGYQEAYDEGYEQGRRDMAAEIESNKEPPTVGTVRPFTE